MVKRTQTELHHNVQAKKWLTWAGAFLVALVAANLILGQEPFYQATEFKDLFLSGAEYPYSLESQVVVSTAADGTTTSTTYGWKTNEIPNFWIWGSAAAAVLSSVMGRAEDPGDPEAYWESDRPNIAKVLSRWFYPFSIASGAFAGAAVYLFIGLEIADMLGTRPDFTCQRAWCRSRHRNSIKKGD